MKIKNFNFVIFLYFFSAFLFLYFVGIDSLDGLNEIQFYADSPTYEKVYKEKTYLELGFFSVGSNFLGPVLILEITGGNRWLVFLMNCLAIYFVFYLIKDVNVINCKKFFLLLFANPLTFQSLLSVNKEIFSILVAVLFFLWITNRSVWYLIGAILFSILARWQLLLIVLVLVPFVIFFNNNYYRRLFVSILFIFFISFAFNLMSGYFGDVVSSFEDSAHLHEGSGFFVLLNQIQMNGYFFIIWFVKFLQISFAMAFNFFNILNFNNFQNDVVIVLSSLSYFFVFFYSARLGLLSFKNKYFIVFVFSASFFSLSPIFAPRYFLFIFVFLMLMVSIRRKYHFG